MKKILALTVLALPLLFTSCLQDKQYEGPSSIDELKLNPTAPTSLEAVEVSIKTSGLQAVTSAVLTYNDGGKPVQMTGSGNQWTGTIPPLPDKTKVTVTVVVTNSAGFTTSKTAEYTVGNPPTDFTKLVINELHASADDDAAKFLEFYNNGDFEIPLKDITIIKNETDLVWTGIEGEVCPGHGYFVIKGFKDKEGRGISAGVSHKKSVKLEVVAPDGTTKIDSIQHGDSPWDGTVTIIPAATVSWSRVPDGTGPYKMTAVTEGVENAATGDNDPEVK